MKTYKIFTVVQYVILIFITGCSTPTEKPDDKTEDTARNLIQISRAQFKEEKMQMGNSVMHSFEQIFQTNGIVTASPQSKADVYSFVSGIVKSISVIPGSYVGQERTLCTIQSKEFIKMQQDYLESLSKLKAIEADYKRVKTLYGEKIASQKDFLSIESEYNILNAGINALKAEFKILNVDLEKLEQGNLSPYLQVLSPIDGYITSVSCNIGQFIDSQTLLMKIVNDKDLQLYFLVYQESVNKLRKGQMLRIYSPDNTNEIFNAKVFSIGKSIDAESKSIKCIAEPEENLRKIFVDGMYFQVDVITDTLRAMAVPSDAVLKADGISYVLAKDYEDDNNIFFRWEEINTGMVTGGYTQVSGNKPLKDVLIKGTYYFQK